MSIFRKIGRFVSSLCKSVLSAARTIFSNFVNWSIRAIQTAFAPAVDALLMTYYQFASFFYVMFYQENDRTNVEIWQPNETSKIKTIERAPDGVQKPSRETAEVYIATT